MFTDAKLQKKIAKCFVNSKKTPNFASLLETAQVAEW